MNQRASAVSGPGSTSAPPPPPGRLGAWRPPADFFRHHGLWAPGVRLFRAVGFGTKAAVISVCFMLPMALLAALLWSSLQSGIDFASKERQGVAAMTRLVPVLHGVVRARNAVRAQMGGHPVADDYQRARQATDAALAAFGQHLADSGDPLALADKLAPLRTAWAATAEAAKDGTPRTAFGPVAEAVVQLLNHIGDDANLVLDPDVDSFYTVNALVLTLPRLADNLGQVWGWGTYDAARGSMGNERAERRFVGWSANTAVYAADLRAYLGRAVAANPALAQPLRLDALAGIDAFTLLAERMTRGEAPRDAAYLYSSGETVLRGLFGLYDEALPALDGLLARRIDGMKAERNAMLAAVAAGLLLAAYLFTSFRKVLEGGLQALTHHIDAMRHGNLTLAPHPWGRDEVATVMHALDDMRLGLGGIVTQVRQSSAELLAGAQQVNDGATDLSARTEANAAALEQTAASMEQISVTVRHTAEHSRSAAELALHNAEVAGQGGALVAEVVQTMAEMQRSSARIGDIVAVIDGLAFQTNLLALNAAVEAARAGPQGKGFAVVASEVRGLAQRSAGAAREIRQLIAASLDTVQACSHRVGSTGQTMDALVDQAARIKQLLADISNGAAEQSAGIVHIGAAVQELDGSTQRNARLVQDTAATAGAMRQQAGRLAEQVARFQVA